MAKINNTDNFKIWWECGTTRALVYFFGMSVKINKHFGIYLRETKPGVHN